jgi:hypothetical protein
MAGGGAFSGCVLLALSFAVAGDSWPLRYYAVPTDGRINPSVDHMPNALAFESAFRDSGHR